MAPRFETEAKRNFWKSIGFGVITDYGVTAVVAKFFNDKWGESLMVALGILLAAYAFLGIYRLICAVRAYLLYKYQYKESIILDMLSKMEQAKMPAPQPYYQNPKDYLLEVTASAEAPSDAKVYAAFLLGRLTTLGEMSMVLAMTLSFALEETIKRYSVRAVY